MRLSNLMLSWIVLNIQTSAATLPDPAEEIGSLIRRQYDSSKVLPVPSQDPWFNTTGTNDSLVLSPGNVLKTRSPAYAVNNIVIGNCINTFQVMYSTTDYNNNPVWSVTTVFIPASHAYCSILTPQFCSHGLVTYDLPYDTCDTDATPSYLLQFGEPYGDMYDLLTRGYFVSVPDYEGRLGSYTSGVVSGYNTLDAVRAVLKVAGDFGFRTSEARTAIWGYSGGALATEFAAELAEAHAPDLALSGVVQGGLVPNVLDSGAQITNLTGFAGLVIAGIIGISSQHPEARAYINSRLKQSGPYNATGFYATCQMTGAELVTNFLDQEVGDYFLNGTNDLADPILIEMEIEDELMGLHGIPKMPMFIYQTTHDELTSIDHVDLLVNGLCAEGANILYHRNNVGGHNEEIFQGNPRVMEYLSAVLDGNTNAISIPATGCQTENVTVAVNVTLVPTTAVMGNRLVFYNAVTITPYDVTVLPNGTVIPSVSPGDEPLSFFGFVSKWKTVLDMFQNFKDATKRLDVIIPSALLSTNSSITA